MKNGEESVEYGQQQKKLFLYFYLTKHYQLITTEKMRKQENAEQTEKLKKEVHKIFRFLWYKNL